MRKNIIFSILVLVSISAFSQKSKTLMDVLHGVDGTVAITQGFKTNIMPYIQNTDTTKAEDVEIEYHEAVVAANTKIESMVKEYDAQGVELNDLGVILKNFRQGTFNKITVRNDIPNLVFAVDGDKLFVINILYSRTNNRWEIDGHPAKTSGAFRNEIHLIY